MYFLCKGLLPVLIFANPFFLDLLKTICEDTSTVVMDSYKIL